MLRRLIVIAAVASLWATAPITASARGLGEVPAGGFRSPEGDTRFTAENGAKPLNNLVFQLLDVKSSGATAYVFRNPREGFVYICIPKPKTATVKLPVAILDSREVALKAVGDNLEAMRYITEGSHTIGIAGGTNDRLTVRAVGELFYAAYGSNPHITETGNYTWAYLQKYCLDNYNSMIGSDAVTADGRSTQEAEVKEWTDQGKRWFTLKPVPDGIRGTATNTADDAYDYWTHTLGMTHPLMSGIFGDEFGPSQGEKLYSMWSKAIRRIHADSKFKDRTFYPYTGSQFWPTDDFKVMYPFVQTLLNSGAGLAVEWYQVEAKSRPERIIETTEDLQAELSPEWEMTSREAFEKMAPGASMNRIVIMGLLSEPGWETGDLYPNYDFNVWLDCQMQFIATDPAYFGIRGVQGYLSSYCGEEQLRLFAKLVRHYFIEGHTERMLKDPYVLTHIQNSDFEKGTEGWTLAPAVSAAGQESIAAKTAPGFGVLQAKYHAAAGTGDKAVWTKRSAKKPNVVSQQIKDLVPGRLYSLRFITGDYQELLAGKSESNKHAISIEIENTEPVAEKCFVAMIGNGPYYPYGPFNASNQYWMNYHQQVFRAKGTTANLSLSDWASEHSAGGPVGEELIWNFIQVQPYFE